MILKRTGVIQQTSQLGAETSEPTAGATADGATKAASTPAWTTLRAGTLLQERYEIVSVIGHGGMSTVYRGRDRRFTAVDRVVAVKEMFNITQDAAARRLRLATFEREANLLATLQHAAIPKIHDYFTFEGRIYLILELIDGQNLETVLEQRRERPTEAEVVSWGVQICDLLNYLHGHKPDPIIFRDLKPSNIMLRRDNRSIVLVDFGIARTFQGVQRGTMIGTEGYAPPEQYRGLASPAGDIYALGATLHHLATGNDPRLETPFTFHQRPPRQLNAALSESFEVVILKAVAYNPNHRFASAEEMRQSLLASQVQPTLVAAPTVAAAPAAPAAPAGSGPLVVEPPTKPVRSRVRQRPRPTTTGPMRKGPPRQSSGLLSQPVAPVADANSRLIWSVRTGDEVRGSPVISQRHLYIGSYDGNLYAINWADGGVAWRASGSRGICSTPAVSDNLVIYGSEDSSIYAVNRSNGRRAWSQRTGLPVRSSARLDGDRVVIGSDDSYVYCLDARSGTLIWRTRTWSHVRSSPIVHGSLIAVGSDDGYLYAIDRDSGSVLWRFQTGAPIVSSPTLARGLLIFGSLDGAIYAVRADGGDRVWRLSTGQPVIASVCCDDEIAYVGSANGSLYALTIDNGDIIWQYDDGSQITSTAAIDSTYLYFGTGDGHIRCLTRDEGDPIWQYKTGAPIPSSPLIADGRLYIGSIDHTVYALQLDEPDNDPIADEADAES